MKRYKRILSVFATVWLLAGMTLFSIAAEPGQLVINNQTVDKISITGDNDGISSTNNSYKITATDEPFVPCGSTTQKYRARTRTMTFTNDYNGWVKITYTIDSNGTFTAGSNCTVSGGVITMQSGGTFTISVTSSTNSEASSAASKSSTFKPTAIEYEALTPNISFAVPSEHGTFTVKDSDGNNVALGNTAKSSSYTLTAEPDTNYQVFRWVFTNSSDAVTYFGEKTTTFTYTASEAGTITCEFMPSDAATYSVNDVEYVYLDDAISAAGDSGTIEVTSTGTVYHSDGETKSFTIPSGVTLVLPYAAGQTETKGSSMESNSYFPYANYTSPSDYSNSNWNNKRYPNPIARDTSVHVELTIPEMTTIVNKGKILVGGALAGNAATTNNTTPSTNTNLHSNLIVNGRLELPDDTSLLSVCGYVYSTVSDDEKVGIFAAGNGAKIFQPLVLIRMDTWGWTMGNAGKNVGIGGMTTYPSDGQNQNNLSPRYATQNIQCRLKMTYGDTMYGYVAQYAQGSENRATVALVGKDTGLISLKSGATLTSTYDSGKYSSTYETIGKQTITIDGGGTGGADQGTLALNMKLSIFTREISLSAWPFPLPYNYDIVLQNGTYNLNYDMSLLPGAGLKVASGATLNITSDASLAVFTGANDHSNYPTSKSDSYPSETTTYSATSVSGRVAYYPLNSTLGSVSTLNGSSGSKMANFIVDGTLNIDGPFGGIVQTTNTGTPTINMNVEPSTVIRQLGLTGHCDDADSTRFAHSGQTIYKFRPQYIDKNTNELTEMVSGKTYSAVNGEQKTIKTYTFDYYGNSEDVTYTEDKTKTETINATAVGQWSTPVTITFDANGGSGTMDAQEVLSGVATALTVNAFTHPNGLTFAGWNTASDGSGTAYADGAEITVKADTTLYAQWEKVVVAQIAGGNSYATLQEAIDNYNGEDYILMLADSGDAVTINKSVLIDLNGYNVSNVTVGATDVEFMDASSNGYATPTGKLTVADGAGNIAAVNTYQVGSATKRYLTIDEGSGVYSFHRLGLSVSSYRIYASRSYLTNEDFDGYITVEGIFRGTPEVFGLLKQATVGSQLGFRFDNEIEIELETVVNGETVIETQKGKETWYPKDLTDENMAVISGSDYTYAPGTMIPIHFTFATDYATEYVVNMLGGFGGGIASDGHQISLEAALTGQKVYLTDLGDERTKDEDALLTAITNYLAELGITD